MGRPLYTNNASSSLAFGISNTDTTMQVSNNGGSLFPNPTGSNFFYVTLVSLSGPYVEIVKCTSRSGDIFTIVRGQEGTTPLYWNNGDGVELRITAAGLNSFLVGIPITEEYQTATSGQTVFNINTFTYIPASNELFVYVNGSKQVINLNYTETSNSSITFLTGLNAGDIVEFVSFSQG